MEKLTLDTNVLRDWAWVDGIGETKRYDDSGSKKAELKKLFCILRDQAEKGRCELGVTSQIYTDLDQGVPDHLAEMIGKHVVIATPGLSTFPIVFPPIFLDEAVLEDILATAFPQTKPAHTKYAKNRKDALQLYAHLTAGRHTFLTSDRTLLASCDLVERRHGIRIRTLSGYLRECISNA
jgi:hypothetical protein